MDKIILKNGSEIIPIANIGETIVSGRSKLMSFYCDGCDCVHIDYPIKDVYCSKSEIYMICKESAEKLHKED